jgi:hypothetical protein
VNLLLLSNAMAIASLVAAVGQLHAEGQSAQGCPLQSTTTGFEAGFLRAAAAKLMSPTNSRILVMVAMAGECAAGLGIPPLAAGNEGGREWFNIVQL